jgi:hypothetical protein
MTGTTAVPRISWVTRRADVLRRRFDAIRLKPVVTVGLLGAIAGGAAWLTQYQARGRCDALPFSFIDFELTFSRQSFLALLHSAEPCGPGAVNSLVSSDLLFALTYSVFLSALYLWGERFRRCSPHNEPLAYSPSFSSSALVILPFVAALLDAVAENLPLWAAAQTLDQPTTLQWLVELGSIGAALKWTTLGMFILGFIGILAHGPRGRVLWRLRYSVIAVAGGALALLAVSQGQDMLQRLVEGLHPLPRVLFAVASLLVTAIVVWYSARVITLVRLARESGSDARYRDADARAIDPWERFFDIHLPRMLGVAVLVLTGAAFARAALAPARFVGVALLSYFIPTGIHLARRSQSVRRRSLEAPADGAPATKQPGGQAPDSSIRMHAERDRPTELRSRAGIAAAGAALGVLVVWPNHLWPWSWQYEARDLMTLRLGAWFALIAAWLLYFLVYYRRDLLARFLPRPGRDEALQRQLVKGYATDHVPTSVKTVTAAAAVVSVILLVAATSAAVPFGRALGPLPVVGFAVANAVFIGSILAYAGRRYHVPLVPVFIALAALFSRWNDNHAIRRIADSAPPDTVHRSGHLRARFDAWLSERATEDTANDTIPVILVAAAGGGLRAAYWTALTLATLQDRDTTNRFAHHVFAISSVSGGSLGGALYTAMVHDMRGRPASLCLAGDSLPHRMMRPRAAPAARVGPAVRCVHRYMNGDFLSPVLLKFVAPDFVQAFLPFPIEPLDRARALEQSWERSYEELTRDSTFAQGYLALYAQDSTETPLLLLNTTHVQTGRRYVTAPFVDDGLFLDARSVHQALGADLPLSTAVHNSARFPFVSPAGRIERRDGQSYGALVDGGYFENSGLTTLGDVRREVDSLLQEHRNSAGDVLHPAAMRARVVVLYLCNDPLACRHDLAADTSLSTGRSVAAEWLSPLLTLLNTRDARGTLARAQMEHARGEDFLQINVCDSIPPTSELASPTEAERLKVGRNRVVNPPLGWLLSRMARDWMDSSLAPGAMQDTARSPVLSCRRRNANELETVLALLKRK